VRRLVASEMVTANGFFSGPNGELDWLVGSEELNGHAQKLIDSVDAIIYGRVTYQIMAGYRPQASGAFADRTNRLPKLVFSSTLDETPWGEWANARPVNGALAEEVVRLKNQPGRGHGHLRQRQPGASAVSIGRDRRIPPRRTPRRPRRRKTALRGADRAARIAARRLEELAIRVRRPYISQSELARLQAIFHTQPDSSRTPLRAALRISASRTAREPPPAPS